MVDLSQRLGRHFSVAVHPTSDPRLVGRPSSWATRAVLPHSAAANALQDVLAHRAIEGRFAIGLGLHALDAGLLLLIAAGLAVGLFD